MPTRVLEVLLEDNQGMLRLHERTSQDRAGYAALSYSWGEPQDVVTFVSNLHAVMQSIPENSLPQSILDAVRPTRGSSIMCLWVGALCIIQDSDEEKTIEISVVVTFTRAQH